MKSLVSIIICTYNRSRLLKSTLHSIIVQEKDDGFDFEIIVVDNNSRDDTRTIVESYIPRFIGNLRYCLEPRQGKSHALNHGIQEAKGDIIAFTDDDVLVDPLWLYHLMECFEQHRCDGVGGRVVPVYSEKTPQWIRENPTKLAGVVVIADYGEDIRLYGKPMDPFIGSNYAFKREVFDVCGLFRTDLGAGQGTMGEDTEFFKRVAAKSDRLFYCGRAMVRHPVDVSRLKLKYIAQWNMALAKYRFIIDEDGKVDENLPSCFGVPRYLVREVIGTGLSLLVKIFNWREFLKAWIKLSLTLGKMSAIRKQNQSQPSA